MFELFFLGFFFTFWNHLIGRFTVAAFTRLFREGCGAHLCILLWPHWIVGIIFPVLIGIATYRPPIAALLIAVTCVLPYTYWIVKLNCRVDDENDNFRTMPCCSCLCKDFHRTNLEKSIICKRVVDGGYDDNDDDDDNCGEGECGDREGGEEKNDVFCFAREDESIVSYRAKHPKSDIVKKRKKKPAGKRKNVKNNTNNTIANTNGGSEIENDHDEGEALVTPISDDNDNIGGNDDGSTNNDTKNNTKNNYAEALSIREGLSFPITLPDENDESNNVDDNLYDVETPCIRSVQENSISNNTDESISESELMCSICLEEYSVGDEIAWSKNDECHHAFHKDCIIEWLVNHQNCPICRKKY